MIRIDDTSGGEVAAAISRERHRQGSPATGMVLTLLILATEEFQSDATAAAVTSARAHPMRIVTLIPRPGRNAPTLDAEIAVGGDDGPGEVAVLRLRGELSEHANSVAIPLLLSDTPVVAFWPSEAPECLAQDSIGKHAQRRISDSAMSKDPSHALKLRAQTYHPGDTDLAWTRLTPWRSALAAALDRPVGSMSEVIIEAEDGNPSALLLATWLNLRLGAPVRSHVSSLPGISAVTLRSDNGDISISRADGDSAILCRPDTPDAVISLPDRDLSALLNEELKRLDPDNVFGSVMFALRQENTP